VYSVAQDVPTHVRGDERAIRQVLFNLLGNAVKFTERGRVEFRVSVANPMTAGSARVRFEIEDTGAGIAPENLQRIFEPFDRGVADQRVEGTGLGLSITQRLVGAMGGSLNIASTPGKGSLFTVEFDLGLTAESRQPGLAASVDQQAINGVKVDGSLATELYDLAMKGDVTELLARTESAAQRDAPGAPLYEEVRRLARRYDMKGVRRILQRVHETRK
jgi:hypothetical protein